MRLSNDLREFLESLNSRGIDYVIVGAHSLETVSGFKNRFVGRSWHLFSVKGATFIASPPEDGTALISSSVRCGLTTSLRDESRFQRFSTETEFPGALPRARVK